MSQNQPDIQWLAQKFGNAVGGTALTTLYARAKVRDFYPQVIWQDPQAEQVWEKLSSEAKADGVNLADFCLTDYMNMVGTVKRGQCFDHQVHLYHQQQKSIQVVGLGIGFCNRAARLAEAGMTWFGVDIPAMVEIRHKYFQNDANTLIGADLTTADWIQQIDPKIPTIFLAEGVFMYLDKEKVIQILRMISTHMQADYRLIADIHDIRVINTRTITKVTGAHFTYGLEARQHLADLCPGWRHLGVVEMMKELGFTLSMMGMIFKLFYGHMPYWIEVLGKKA